MHSAQTLANTINADSKATVYAAAVNGETLVLSTRETGATGAGFIQVSDPGGTLVEQAALAKEGRNAEYKLDGVAASSTTITSIWRASVLRPNVKSGRRCRVGRETDGGPAGSER